MGEGEIKANSGGGVISIVCAPPYEKRERLLRQNSFGGMISLSLFLSLHLFFVLEVAPVIVQRMWFTFALEAHKRLALPSLTPCGAILPLAFFIASSAV